MKNYCMEKIYQKVLEHAKGERVQEGEKNIEELLGFLNIETDLKFPKNSIAIFTIIRQSYNNYIEQNLFNEAEIIAKTYRPTGYVYKVLNKYELRNNK